MAGAVFGFSTPHILVVRIGTHPAAPDYLPPGTGFRCHEVHWPSSTGNRDLPGQPDLIILDFPPADSMDFSVCPHIKTHAGVPVIVIGADTQTDRIVSLELGADDYLSRPFHPKELAARARAVLRSCGRPLTEHVRSNRVSARWTLDHAQRSLVAPDDTQKKLNTVEYWLLQHFMAHPNQILSREDMADYLHDKQSIPYTPLSMIVFVNGLREKLEDFAPFSLIKTVRGRGYVYPGKG